MMALNKAKMCASNPKSTSSFTLLKITTAANTTKDTVSMSNFAFLSLQPKRVYR